MEELPVLLIIVKEKKLTSGMVSFKRRYRVKFAGSHLGEGAGMQLKNFLLVVEDIKRAMNFYREIFGLEVLRDFDSNVILMQGLVLQERKSWEQSISKDVKYNGKDTVLYFEDYDLEAFVEKIKGSGWDICFLNPLQTLASGQKMLRFCDPDGHVIEIREAKKNYFST